MTSDLSPLTSLRTFAFAAALVLVGAFCLGRCSAPDALPAGVQLAVDRHQAASVADTVTTHRLERVAAAAEARARTDSIGRRRAEYSAALAGRRADSLAAIAAATAPSTEVAITEEPWHVAYLARTEEADSLLVALHQAGTELEARAARQAASDSIADVWKQHALRGDSVIAQLLPLARQADRCRILWVISCPTRRQAFAIGLVGGVAGVLAADR